MKLKTIIASAIAAFTASACTTTSPEQQKQTGKLVTDSSGCTYWKDTTDAPGKPKSCILKDRQTP